ncbi:uncharacterized protein J4E78_002723 [Alternaria triticimaculans]|uniref:uncharacterized protein n=1 Tax=Alternaria triticimaculans TaxID=297637 RepID=UPI0020C3CF8A|nr:uncharacterized protein J4E78_002723 [Alternaria triticimaculans]KAI4665263.1 hypothetical protein J4E78_002723 [Alternaria triticimaculans]
MYEHDTPRLFDRKDEYWFHNMFVKRDVERVQHFYPPSGDLFERLPNEIIDQIFDYILLRVEVDWESLGYERWNRRPSVQEFNREDFLALCLSSARLWPLALARIHRSYQKANWVGKRVGFHFERSKLTAEQMRNYGIEDTPAMINGRQQMRSQQNVGDQGWDRTWNHFRCRPENDWCSLMRPMRGYTAGRGLKMAKYELTLRPGDRDKIERDLGRANLPVTGRDWVLRNITTRQYVRSDQLDEPPSPAPDWDSLPKFHEPVLSKMQRIYRELSQQVRRVPKNKSRPLPESDQALTLANIFLVLTCSNPDCPSPGQAFDFSNGPWAGCAFEVFSLDDHLQSQQRELKSGEQPGKAWVNVSKEVVADVANLRFCIRRLQEMRHQGHERYFRSHDPAVNKAYWDNFWNKVEMTRKLHRQWVKTCPPRPWIDESMYAET